MAAPAGLVPLPPNIGAITSAQLVGTMLNFFLFGTLRAIKALVYFVFLTMSLCTCLNAADAHYWFASGFGDIVKFSKAGFSPFYTPLMGSIIALVVQLFFCYRISVFRAGALWWSVLIAVISLLQAVGGIGGGIIAFIAANETHDQARTVLVYLWLVGDAVADTMIAVTMTHLLSKAADPQTKDIVNGIVRLIIETNMFSASVAIVGLALFAGMPGTDYFIAPTMVLPGLYANTLLVLLNNRALPSRARARDHVVSSGENASVTANGTSTDYWKSSSAGPHLNLNRARIDGVAIPIGAFEAAPNPSAQTHIDVGGIEFAMASPTTPMGRFSTGENHAVSGWDDASYKQESLEGADGAGSLGVQVHPYRTAGTYGAWAR
ncbi:hypothetical protein C8R46DRAFT_1209169 [Mycena filopes]|nr:hypothetical protein C8R46DRAFT_1209169 [Mycena filopes]